jgi:DNA-binding CsgD family transcriptional regulator
VLAALGLDERQAAVYHSLVEHGASDLGLIERRVGFDPVRALESLEAQGLVMHMDAHPLSYAAAPPSVALGAVAMARRQELQHAELEIARLAELYRTAEADRSLNELIEVVVGRAAIASRFTQLQATATAEVCSLVRPNPSVVTHEENTVEADALARGVGYRVVIERESFERPGFYQIAAEALRLGVRVRVGNAMPSRLIIVDRREALISLNEPDPFKALVVHSSGLLEALSALFECVWRESLPLVLGSDGVAGPRVSDEELDRSIVGLLLVGFTDESIATRLGLSVRTVQRRVSALMATMGAQARLQLGFHLASRGWAPAAVTP